MTLAQRIKKGLTKMIPATKIEYKAKEQPSAKPYIRKKQTPAIKQYGDKGYSPVGRNVKKK